MNRSVEAVYVNTQYTPEEMAAVDEYGSLLMGSAFNAATKRGRSAVIRKLIELGLDAEKHRLAAARRRVRMTKS